MAGITIPTESLADAYSRGVAEERERCAKIAEMRAKDDRIKYQSETDWRMPYAYNRVVRASLDIAAAIRKA